ncbi:hypothetical protein DSCA_36290 [Desulfosarcina alkanivorans]|jgi:signal transduction histidine kinase/DNA-binding response OmpR family regulator|uniref:histidine kinase n=1 Tax=Desulfosarcina alkanivorans TaxID=571177 RepID=A0A5K7YPA5_9BACT|nr:response regulator [Desulfosarcina alkanivorans]BBO69699.1 hypothetical protein DSCA_36290 [Desulfosarcina alkanivorans]
MQDINKRHKNKYKDTITSLVVSKDTNLNVLIVDDEPDILNTLNTILTLEGYNTDCASCGEEAIELFNENKFGLVITDMRMPGIDGLEVTKQVKRLDRDVEVIILTGFASVENVINALKEYCAFGYLTKPLENIHELLYTIQQAFERRRLRIENRAFIQDLKKTNAQLNSKNEKIEAEIEIRKRYEIEIKKKTLLLHSLIDGFAEPMLLLGNDLIVKMLNKAAADFYEMQLQDAIGKPFKSLMLSGYYPLDNDEIRSIISNGNAVSIEKNHPSNKSSVNQIDVYPIKDNKTVTALVIRISDISKKKRDQEMINRIQRLSSLGQLSSGFAHEIRNPLAGLNLFLDVLSDRNKFNPTDEQLEIYRDMSHNVKRIAKIVKKLIKYGEKSISSKIALDLNSLVEDTINGRLAELGKVKINCSLARNLPPIFGDRKEIRQVIDNLLCNANESVKNGGRIDFKTFKGSSTFKHGREAVFIQLVDNGHGIQSKHLSHIFDPFFSTKHSQLGLGLAISNQIIRQHGGTISVSSDPGEGSSFIIELPL